jgi:hypothetical protein
MTDQLISKAEQHAYQQLFLHDLHWSAPDHPPIQYTEDDRTLTATNISSYKGLRVWVCDEKPGSKLEAHLDREIARTSTDRLVIFHDGTDQVWRWPVRRNNEHSTTTRLTSHKHRTGDPDPRFTAKLDAIRLPIDVALDPNAVLAKVRSAFDVEAQNETKHASKLMARMYAAMEKAYPPGYDRATSDHQITVTLARVLFLMFGDDTDMWPQDLFRDFIHQHTATDGSDIGHRLSELFAYLDTAPTKQGRTHPEFKDFRYVNGRIFSERITLPAISVDFRTVIIEACDRDWATISPAIFGSMFQSVRDAQTRRELGEHYTSEENILKTLNPLFLDELRTDFEHIKTLGKYEADRLRKLRHRLGDIRFMDPACGCGNFIIVAYRELRDLELAIMERLQEITGDGEMLLANIGLKVNLDHFYGIEIDEWPAKIAETAMFLIDRQCDLKLTERLGWAPDRLPIQEQATINVGNALTLDWAGVLAPTDDVIIAGNPPFLGHATRSEQQAQELRDAWGKDDISRLDYVTGWHARALKYFRRHSGQWAFVTTNSITQGDPVPHLFGPIFDAGWRIKFAYRTFPWTSEASGKAAVHCVIVGFTKASAPARRLFDLGAGRGAIETSPDNINAYLADGPNVFVVKRRVPLAAGLPEALFGAMPRDGGNLIVEPSDYEAVMADRIAAKYVRPFKGAEELVRGKERWCLWLTGMPPSDASNSPVLRERLAGVRAMRLASTAESTRKMAATPHLFGQRPPERKEPYVGIPSVVSESRQWFTAVWLEPDVIVSNLAFTADDPDGFLFAIISSSMFMTWQRTVGGRLKSDLRFSNTIVWNNLPVPRISRAARTDITEAGKAVLQARALHPEKSLSTHYDPTSMTGELVAAHHHLDALVDQAFGANGTCETERDRQQVLFARYEELATPLFGSASDRGRK